jgi:hypothetical protein
MHRRELGRGRILAALGALIALVGCLLPWYGLGGVGVIPIAYGAFDGSGILTFLAALATLALVALPYAVGDRPVGVDRGIVYGLLLLAAAAGLALWLPTVFADLTGIQPQNAPGWWIALVGVLVYARGVFEIVTEPTRR